MIEVDPITFEVVKQRLWQINDEQSVAIRTISSSPIVVEGNDFNVGLFTADGRLTTAGIGSLVHVGTMSVVVKNVLSRVEKLNDGDVYLINDPFLGALHQNDVVLVSPFFVDGEIVLWIGNVLHHPDVGGTDVGSFCINARTLYQDPPRYFLKLCDQGVLSAEVEHTFSTNSRLPDMVALDLKAQLGAIHAAKERLRSLVDECGVALVSAVANRSIETASVQFQTLLKSLPDGVWSTRTVMDGARVGDDALHYVQCQLSKENDRLTFDFTGSSPQIDAAVNCTYHATFAGTVVPLYSFLCQGDIDWNDGLVDHVDVVAPEGTVVNASFPAPVSICTIGMRWLVTVAATRVVSEMLQASSSHRDRVCPSWNVAANCNNVFGVTADGKRFGTLLSDHRGGGAGARSFADGFSHAGQITSFASSLGNVESAEWKAPILYLFRKRLIDSGGAGRFRGGLTAMTAVIPRQTGGVQLNATNTAGTIYSNAFGLHGGYPGVGSQSLVVRGVNLDTIFETANTLDTFHDLNGSPHFLDSKASETLSRNDALVFFAPGGGGYGDPIERAPELVVEDIRYERVSQLYARELYGVVLTESGELNADATAVCRDSIRKERMQRPPLTSLLTTGESDGLGCEKCCDTVSRGDAPALLLKPRQISPWAALKSGGDTKSMRILELTCPKCATLLSVEEVDLLQFESSETESHE